MTATAKKLLEDALALPEEEREALVDALAESLDQARVSQAWTDEIGSRIEQVASGRVKRVPWEDVEARIRKTLSQA